MPEKIETGLRRVADATGKIGYADIEAFGRNWSGMAAEKKDAVVSLLSGIDGMYGTGGTLDPADDAVMDAVMALAGIVNRA